MANVLVTGASGFIGFHAIQLLLSRGHNVAGLVRESSNTSLLRPLSIELAIGDVSNVDSLRKAITGKDIVLHLAGLTKAKSVRDLLRANQHGCFNVAAACADQPSPPRLVYVSSLAAVGPATDGRAVTELQRPCPVSNYGRSKLAGEQATRTFASQVPITVVRPPIVFGEVDRSFFNIVRPIHRTGVHTVPGLSPKTFSLIHAADLAVLLLDVAERGERLVTSSTDDDADENASLGVYFAEAEQRVTYGELGQTIAAALGRSVRCVALPHAAIWLAAGVAQAALRPLGRVPALNLDKAREATAGSWFCSADKAKSQFAFEPQLTISERMDQTVAWYRAQNWI